MVDRYKQILYNNVFENQAVIIELFDEIAGQKIDVVELGKVEDVRFEKHGGGDVELLADLGQIVEKAGIGKPLLPFINELFFDFAVHEKFCPDFHKPSVPSRKDVFAPEGFGAEPAAPPLFFPIIQENVEKVNEKGRRPSSFTKKFQSRSPNFRSPCTTPLRKGGNTYQAPLCKGGK